MVVRRFATWAFVATVAAALVFACEVRARRRVVTAVSVMSSMVEAARAGQASRLSFSRDDQAALEAARPWLGASFKVVCGEAPPLSRTLYECHVLFTNGAFITGDVDLSTGSVRGVTVDPPRPHG